MLLQAFNDPEYLERLTGLDKMKEEARAMEEEMEAVEWDEEEDED
jgi:ubiquitin-like modifier-activating enzyme ATG7